MKIAVDTNVLVRLAVYDDIVQVRIAEKMLKAAEIVVIGLPCLCEFVWVLRGVYGYSAAKVAGAIELLLRSASVVVDRSAVEAGLALMRDGGDFADGVIAHEGTWRGGEFVSFDRRAVALLVKQGYAARLLR